ncbi:MAG: thioredoxin family protein [Planctomycetota bacterium]
MKPSSTPEPIRTHGPIPFFLAIAACLVCGAFNPAIAGEYNRVLSIGDAAPSWDQLPGTDEASHSLKDLAKHKAILVVFTCNSCPYAVDAEDELISIANRYQRQGLAVVAINVNTIVDDRLPAMKERAEEKKFPFPYLYDASQEVAKQYGAKTTPESFLLDGQRKIVYMGGLVDADKKPALVPAIDDLLAGDAIATAETPAVGCLIRFNRPRGGRRSKK